MASWFRSEDMTYVSIIVNDDAALSCISDLGKLGVVQFTDLNPELTPFQRRYVNFIKRIDELERKIKFFGEEIHKFGLHAAYQGEVGPFIDSGGPSVTTPTPGASGKREGSSRDAPSGPRSGVQLLEMLEKELETDESHLVDLNRYNERLTTEYNEKVEFQEVLLKTRGFFVSQSQLSSLEAEERATGVGGGGSYQADGLESGSRGGSLSAFKGGSNTRQAEPYSNRDPSELKFSYIAGVINMDDRSRFERQLFRSTRGNCYIRFTEIEQTLVDPTSGDSVKKLVFLVFFKSAAIEAKIKKIADAFGAKRYPVPDMDNADAVRQLMDDNYGDLHDARLVLLKNRDARIELCTSIAARIEIWNWTVLREKAAYHALNAFKPDVRGIMRGEGWVVTEHLPQAQAAVKRAHANMGIGVPSYVEVLPQPWPTAPTYFKTNAFTAAFQEFVDTYGVPRYKEANPALFAAATFPFLYGVMYGDIGHGTFLFLLGVFLVISHGKKVSGRRAGNEGELTGGLYLARWMLLLMGAFSVYAGIIYNDWFSIALNLFGTRYTWPEGRHTEKGTPAILKQGEYGDPSNVYPFGMDPSWHVSDNELLFYNSMKMKMSVVLGIFQMTLGIVLKALNAKYFNQPLDFYLEFIPMIIFDLSLFGYMVILIFLKWTINWDARMYSATCLPTSMTPAGMKCVLGKTTTAEMCPLNYGGTGDGCQPPNLITTLINIALAPGSVEEPMYSGQAGLQTFLLLVAFACIPVLLLGKPYMINKASKERATRHDSFSSEHALNEESHQALAEGGHAPIEAAHGGGGHEDFSEVVIHQAIETIEFVLGMVSNTASYLRLWALSLAHTELATVFWEKAMLSSINTHNPIAVYLGFAVFFAVTFGVLLCMDVLECFLHALRLHWVEFQNKFYKADGIKFAPFAFLTVLEAAPMY